MNVDDASKKGQKDITEAPQAGSLSHMLVQALHSNDNTLLEEVWWGFGSAFILSENP